ncbi:MAG: potassium transporter TrkG [Bacteroidales bacterium]
MVKKNIETSKQSIPISLINRATTIFIFAVAIIFISIFALSISDPNIEFSHLLFEAVSAFSTVGFSTGLTPELSLAGKVIIMLNMFIGRVGPLTLGFALSKKVLTNRYKISRCNNYDWIKK